LLLGGLLFFNLLLYAALVERQPTGWDALGYQVASENIVQGIGPAIEHPLNQKLGPYFTLAAFAVQHPQEPARLYLNYPPGFPLLLAIPQWIGLPDFFVLPVVSTLSVFLTCVLGSLLFDRWTGLLGAAIVALTPAYLEWGTSFWADLPGACFMLGALIAYVAAWRKKERIHQIILCSVAGGLVALTISIKYSNALVLLPLFVYAAFTQRKATFNSIANWVFVAIIVAGLAPMGLYNQSIYGSPFDSNYAASPSGFDSPRFSISYALGPSPADGHSLIGAGKTLWENFSWLLIAAVLGLTKGKRETMILLGGLFLAFLTMHSIYAWAPIGVNKRFLLPLFAPVGLLAAQGCLSLLELGWKKWAVGLVLLTVGVTSLASLPSSWRQLEKRNQAASRVRLVSQDLTSGSEPHAIFMAYGWNDRINYFGERTTLFYRRMNSKDRDEFESTLIHTVAELLHDGVPVYYVVDADPPFAKSLQVLQQSFDLYLWKETPIPVYRVQE
jgi:riboflavin transporter FmnP